MTTTTPAPLDGKAPPKSSTLRAGYALVSKLGPVIGLAFVFILFAALRPRTFMTGDNVQIMLLQTAVVGTAALGMTMIIVSGGIDLSIGSNIALCTVVIAFVLNHLTPKPASEMDLPVAPAYAPFVAAAAGIAATTTFGLLIGLLVTRLRLLPFIVTLGMLAAIRGAAEEFAGERTIDTPPTWLNGVLKKLGPHDHWMLVSPGVWLMLILTVLVGLMLRYTRFGRHIFAIGSNEQTARLCGVRVNRTKVLTYVVATVFVGIAGLLQYSYLTIGDPTTAIGYELAVIAACVIGGASLNGGQGSVLGTLIGALIMTVVSNGCTKVGLPNPVQNIVTGGIIILAVALDNLRHKVA